MNISLFIAGTILGFFTRDLITAFLNVMKHDMLHDHFHLDHEQAEADLETMIRRGGQ